MSISGNNILAGASGGQEYKIDRSLRFNSGDSAHLTRTPSSSSNSTTFTWSAWIKVNGSTGTQTLFSATSSGSLQYDFILTNNQLDVYGIETVFVYDKKLSRVFRDPSAWYHLVVAFDTTDSTAEDRIKIYVNGERETDFATNTNPSASRTTGFNKTVEHSIGGRTSYSTGQYFDGYQTEINFIDGSQLGPENFGETDPVTGAWIPKQYSGTYGTNGFYLKFADNSGVTATTLGKDSSGNSNNWTPNNFSVTAGAGNDSLEDTPTNNWCTWNSLSAANNTHITFTEGNLKLTSTVDSWPMRSGTFGVSTGKWYYETKALDITRFGVGWGEDASLSTTTFSVSNANSYLFWSNNPAQKYETGTNVSINGSPALANNDIIGVAIDFDAGKIWYSINGTWLNDDSGNVGDPAGGNNPQSTFTANTPMLPNAMLNLASFISNFGQRAFDYTLPTGFKALNTANTPVPTIKNGTEYFNTVLYTGTGSSNAITGVGFQPDWVWIKKRSASENHELQDAVRGATKRLASNTTDVETTVAGSISSFDSDGFTVVDAGTTNENTSTYVGWNWKAGGSGSANTVGTISSTVSVNADAGFSIVKYTGNGTDAGSSTVTVGHGLGKKPDCIITKKITSGTDYGWSTWHKDLGAGYGIWLHLSSARNAAMWDGDSNHSSTVFSPADSAYNNVSGSDYINYVFTSVEGYSKFGSYTGNGSTDGTFVYLGFRPAVVITKRTDSTGSWFLYDAQRDAYNSVDDVLFPDLSNAEASDSSSDIDFLSNGFKIRTVTSAVNTSTATYVFMAFAETPFKYATAR